MLKKLLGSMFHSAAMLNQSNILDLIPVGKKVMDLGCDDGVWSKQVAGRAQAQEIHGIELNEVAARKAQAQGLQVKIADLNLKLPYNDNTFDVVHANQVIEHVPNIDHFAKEAARILKPGGSLIVSTENGSSWHNVFAAVMGWQIFSLTNLSSLQSGIGNPLALHRNTSDFTATWTHKVIFNYRGLIEFIELHGFSEITVKGAGYYPFPSFVGQWDPRHAHFITLRAKKV